MVYVLVIGCGHIGKHAARYLAEAGHHVSALIRDEKKATELLTLGVYPVVGDATRPETFQEAIAKASVIIDTVLIFGQDLMAANKGIIAAVAAESKKSGVKKRYIYISGGWVYGDYPGEIVDESFKPKNPMSASRIAFEKVTVEHTEVRGVVLRPSSVYGGDWGIWRWLWYKPEKLVLTGHKDRTVGWQHVADVSDALLRIVEAPTALVAGEIFDICESTRIGYYDLRRAIFKAAGYTVPEEDGPLDQKNFVDMASNIRLVYSAEKIRRVLGWKPRHSILDELDLSYKNLFAHGLLKPPAKKES
jgi:nucleoside-diphosphate-sugar epimerase